MTYNVNIEGKEYVINWREPGEWEDVTIETPVAIYTDRREVSILDHAAHFGGFQEISVEQALKKDKQILELALPYVVYRETPKDQFKNRFGDVEWAFAIIDEAFKPHWEYYMGE